ncbi:MAG: archaemetzincin family Zn-dependent metalloprotease [Myxococcaceae bacterium]
MSAPAGEPITLWWVGEGEADERLMEELRREVEKVYGPPVAVCRRAGRPADTLDPRRGQHSSTAVLRWLAAARPEGARKTLAITDVDLFIPVLTYVFGEAQLAGPGAVVSTARLSPEPGTFAPAGAAKGRLVKECVHELGHTFGLTHCDDRGCVMTRSINLREVDEKRAGLCRNCRDRLRELGSAGRTP